MDKAKKEDNDVITQDKVSFLFYKARHDAAIKIFDRCMQHRNGVFDAVKDV